MEFDWATVISAATVATGVATVVSACLTVVWRMLDRERVAWIAFDGYSAWHEGDSLGSSTEPSASAEIANVGRGPGLAVRVVGLGCTAQLLGPHRPNSFRQEHSVMPALRVGEQVHVHVRCEPDNWEHAEVVISWTPAVGLRRRRRKLYRVPLREVAARPRMTRSDPKTYRSQEAPQQPGPGLYLSEPREDLPLRPPALRPIARVRQRRLLLRR